MRWLPDGLIAMRFSEPLLMGCSQMQPICSLPPLLPPFLPSALPSVHLPIFLFTHPSSYPLILSSFYPFPPFLLFKQSPYFLLLFLPLSFPPRVHCPAAFGSPTYPFFLTLFTKHQHRDKASLHLSESTLFSSGGDIQGPPARQWVETISPSTP